MVKKVLSLACNSFYIGRKLMTTTSDKIKVIRSEMDITQEQLARILNISRSHVSELETGKKQPSEKVLNKIDKLYKTIPMVQIFMPKPVKVKKSWFDRLWDWIIGWRG